MYTLSALTGGIAARFTGGSEGMSRAGRALANVSHEGGETLGSRLGALSREVGAMAKAFSVGWKGRPRGIYMASEYGALQGAYDGLESGLAQVSRGISARRAAAQEVRLYRNRALGGVDDAFIADPRLVVDMPYVGKGAQNANAQGWLRDARHYWDEILNRHPEAFSYRNRQILAGEIEGLTSPVNDATFRSVFTQYDVRGLRGKTLVHHHIGGGGQAFAIPSPLHMGFGGVHNAEKALGIWGGEAAVADMLERLMK